MKRIKELHCASNLYKAKYMLYCPSFCFGYTEFPVSPLTYISSGVKENTARNLLPVSHRELQ